MFLEMKELSNYLKHSNQTHFSQMSCSDVIICCFISFSLNTDYRNRGDELLQQIEECSNQKNETWEAIHECMRTNDLQKLKTLLSKHTINLNSFHLSIAVGDTILRAAKSNDMKMMEFILQRLSPSIKHRMLTKMNDDGQLPSDLVTVWTPSTHSLFPLKFRQVVKAVLMLGAKRQDGTPYYPSTNFPKML
jgi:hypothetical protein